MKMGLRAIEWGGMDWIKVTQEMDRWLVLVNRVTNFRVP
jgi:hypothetical protein